MNASISDVEKIIQAASKVDWLAILRAIESHFADKEADKEAEQSVEELVKTLAPIIAPMVLGTLGASLVPFVGLIVPALALAVLEYRGGDPDPIHDAQTTRNFNPGDTAASL